MKLRSIINLGTKNLMRYKRRTFITGLVLAVGIASYIILDSMLVGMQKESEYNLIRYEMGQGRLVTPAYWEEWEDRPIKEVIENPEAVRKELADRGIASIRRIEFNANGVLSSGIGGTFPVIVTAADMEEDLDVLIVLKDVSEGRLPEPGREEAVIGQWMAQDLGIGLGDVVTIPVIDRWGSRDAMAVEITGFLQTPNPEVNRGAFFIPLDTADDYLAMEGAVTQLTVDLPLLRSERRRALSALEEAAGKYGLEYHKWEDWSALYLAMAAGDEYGSAVILFLVFIIASVGLANTMLMSVMERQKEIGMMRSLGVRDGEILLLLLTEALLIGAVGSLAGMAMGVLGNIPLVNRGMDFTFLMRDFSIGYRFNGVMYGDWTASSFIYGFLAGLFICVTVAWLAVRKIMKKTITEEIRAA